MNRTIATLTLSLAAGLAPAGGAAAQNLIISNANRCRQTISGPLQTAYYYQAAPAAAEYDVSGVVTYFTDINEQSAIAGRIDTAAATA